MESGKRLSWGDRLLVGLVGGVAGFFLVELLVIMAWRVRYPFELEWIESAAVDSCRWILSGHFLYERPTLNFIPLLYTPLYFYMSAALTAVVGPGFLAPRLVSVWATLGSCGCLWALTYRETGRHLAGLAAAGFYAATYLVSGAYMDVARADALLVGLLMVSALVIRRYPGYRGAVYGATTLAAAWFTKQSALPFIVAMCGFYLLESRREWRVFWPLVGGLILGISAVLEMVSGGWYSFYTWYLVRQTVLDAERIRAFWTLDLLPHVPLALVAGMVTLAFWGRPWRLSSEGSRIRFYLAWTVGAVASAWWNRSVAGAHINVLLPLMATLGLLMGLMIGTTWPLRWRKGLQWGAAILFGTQCVWLAYDPRPILPTMQDEQAGWRLVEELRTYPGEVFVPAHSYYAVLAGKAAHAHWAAFTDAAGVWDTNLDVQRGRPPDPRREALVAELDAALAQKRFAAIILDDVPKEQDAFWNVRLEHTYRWAGRLFTGDTVFWTVTGVPLRPQLVYVPR